MRLALRFFACVCVLCVSVVVAADPITYTFAGTATGIAGTQAFTLTPFVIVVSSDTSTITQSAGPGIFTTGLSAATIDIMGVGSGTFTTPKLVFDNQNLGLLGLSDQTSGDLLDLSNAGFSTYDLSTSYGPVTDPAPTTPEFQNIASSLGPISFDTAINTTFTASKTSGGGVPEASSVVLLGSMCLGGVSALYVLRRLRGSAPDIPT